MTAPTVTRPATTVAQAPSAVVMVRPHHFTPNPQTLADNAFQSGVRSSATAGEAFAEITVLAETLRSHGVGVHLFEDEEATRPDSVFCNNWFSTHADGTVVVYPMHAENRRTERRDDVVDLLARHYRVERVLDLSGAAGALEGTGAMVLDHVTRTAYVGRSHRTNGELLDRWCAETGFRAVVFEATDRGVPVYHTNVLMSVCSTFALVGAELLDDPTERRELLGSLADSGRQVLELPRTAIRSFAGNCLELQGSQRLLVMSRTGVDALSPSVRERVEQHVGIVAVDVPTLELAGGSVRCTLAGVHLTAKPQSVAGTVAASPSAAAASTGVACSMQ